MLVGTIPVCFLLSGSLRMSSNAPFVELRNVTFGYGDRVILRDLSLQVPRGKVTALMGASGGGKTTVLRLIGGQNHAQQGQVLFDGQDVTTMDAQQLYAARRRMGMLFQFGALFTDMSVFDNVAFPLREHTDLPEELIRDIVLMKLHAVGLRGARDRIADAAEGEIDLTIMQELMKAAQGLSVTFHRAFDVCRDPKKALEQIIALGCNRILTSGQQPTAESGIPLLKELQEQAAGRIILLAGCGVNEKNIHRIASETGIREFHFSARENIKSGMNYKNESYSKNRASQNLGGPIYL